MSKQKLTTEKIFSKKTIKANRNALDVYRSYKDTADSLDVVKYALGQKKSYRMQNRSTLNSKVNYNEIGSTQNFHINSRLA